MRWNHFSRTRFEAELGNHSSGLAKVFASVERGDVRGCAPRNIPIPETRFAGAWRAAATNIRKCVQPLHLPLAVEAGEAGLAGEELLHGGLFEVALLGDEPVQPAQQPIHIAQRLAMARCSGLGGTSSCMRRRSARVISRNVVPLASSSACLTARGSRIAANEVVTGYPVIWGKPRCALRKVCASERRSNLSDFAEFSPERINEVAFLYG